MSNYHGKDSVKCTLSQEKTGNNTSLLATAKKMLNSNLSVIPTKSDKTPAVKSWKPYQQKAIHPKQVKQNFSRATGLGLVTGFNNVEGLDFDLKYDLTGTLYARYWKEVNKLAPTLKDKLVIQKTVNNGYHAIYRCDEIEGNQKLASRATTKEERAKNKKEKQKVLIETRGKFGYFIIAPSTGYKLLQNDFSNIPTITAAERNILFTVARSFNEKEEAKEPTKKKGSKTVFKNAKSNNTSSDWQGITPSNDYNNSVSCEELLTAIGWTIVKENSTRTYLKRAGETSAKTSGNIKDGIFYCFSTSTEFESEKGYTPFQIYALLEHNNDFSAAGKELYKLGFGDRQQPKAEKLATEHKKAETAHLNFTFKKYLSECFKGKNLERIKTFFAANDRIVFDVPTEGGKSTAADKKMIPLLSKLYPNAQILFITPLEILTKELAQKFKDYTAIAGGGRLRKCKKCKPNRKKIFKYV